MENITTTKGPVLVDFFAKWCQPCKVLDKTLQDLDGVKVLKIDVEENTDLSIKYQVRSVPTLVLFKDGVQIGVKSGSLSLNTIKEWVAAA